MISSLLSKVRHMQMVFVRVSVHVQDGLPRVGALCGFAGTITNLLCRSLILVASPSGACWICRGALS